MSFPQCQFQLQDLGCMRGDNPLFAGLSLTVSNGELLQLEGPNGMGKTSLLRILCTLSPATQGQLLWNSQRVEDDPASFRAQLAYLAHLPAIKLQLTAAENLTAALAVHGVVNADIAKLLATVGLAGYESVQGSGLSAGQRRRLGLARIIGSQTPLWVMDEPFTGMDIAGRALVEAQLSAHLGAGGMAIVATHHAIQLSAGQQRVLALQDYQASWEHFDE